MQHSFLPAEILSIVSHYVYRFYGPMLTCKAWYHSITSMQQYKTLSLLYVWYCIKKSVPLPTNFFVPTVQFVSNESNMFCLRRYEIARSDCKFTFDRYNQAEYEPLSCDLFMRRIVPSLTPELKQLLLAMFQYCAFDMDTALGSAVPEFQRVGAILNRCLRNGSCPAAMFLVYGGGMYGDVFILSKGVRYNNQTMFDRQVTLMACKMDPYAYSYIQNEDFKKDKEIIRAAIIGGMGLTQVPLEIRADIPFVRSVVSLCFEAYKFLPEDEVAHEMLVKSIKAHPFEIHSMPAKWRTLELAEIALQESEYVFEELDIAFKKNKSIAMKCKSSKIFQDVPSFLNDKEVVQHILKHDGHALLYIPEEQRTEELVDLAIKSKARDVLQYIPKHMKSQLYMQVVACHPDSLEDIPEDSQTVEMILCAIENGLSNVCYAPKFLDNKEIAIAILAKRPYSIKKSMKQWGNDITVAEALVTQHQCYNIIEYFSEAIQQKLWPYIVQHGENLHFVPKFASEEEILSLLQKHPSIWSSIVPAKRNNVQFICQAVKLQLQAGEALDKFATNEQKQIVEANPYVVAYSTDDELIEYAMTLAPDCAPWTNFY